MERKKKRFICNTSLIFAFALTVLRVFGQQDATRLPEQWKSYNDSMPQQKIYVHTDKDFYLAGEIVWFKVYQFDGHNDKPDRLNKVVYVEILDKDNKPLLQAKIGMRPGEKSGSFHIPLSVNSGGYKLRAYSSWLRNFGPDFFFEKQLTIVNTLKNSEAVKRSLDTVFYNAGFFPEGGDLVLGLQNRIAFKVTDKFGRGLDYSGYIIADDNDTVASFRPLAFGMGSLNFTPGSHKYRGVFVLENGTKIERPLPEILPFGLVMQVRLEADKIIASITSTAISEDEEAIYLVIRKHDQQLHVLKSDIKRGRTQFAIEKQDLGEGVNQLTLVKYNGKPVCERLIFIRPKERTHIAVHANSPDFATRSKVNLQIESTDSSGHSVPADLSLSVYKIDSLQTRDLMNIGNYLWLTSDLKGFVESPDYYFGEGSEVDAATDNLMLTQGWRRFSDPDVPKKPVLYPLEYNGHLVTARVLDTRTGNPAKGVVAYLSIPGLRYKFYIAKSDSLGALRFDVKDYFGAGEVMVQPGSIKDTFYRIQVLNPFSEVVGSSIFVEPELMEKDRHLLEKYSIGMQAQNIYSSDSLKKFDLPVPGDTLPFYGKPAATYMLDDYTRFTTMEEVLREYVRDINVAARGGRLFVKMFNQDQKDFFEQDILLMVDGVPLLDPNKIFSYDPLKVKRIDVIPRAYIYGPAYYAGMASFTTYGGNLEGYELDPHVVAIDYEGLQLKREFYSPVYETEQQIKSRLPDFRNVLFWSPNLLTGQAGKTSASFYTSDIKGSYLVEVQGTTSDGKVGSGSFFLQVK